MPRVLQAATLFVVLVLVFQCDPNFRAWEREILHQMFSGEPASPPPPARSVADHRPRVDRPDPYAGDSPQSPLVDQEADFPGPGWYRVKLWRGWLAEDLCECLATSHRHIATEDEWWDMCWGRWDKEAGSRVGADARMYTTNGIRLDQPPPGDGSLALADQ